MIYVRKPEDTGFRRVSLTANAEPPFEAFTVGSQRIEYSDNMVLEIQRADDSVVLVYDAPKETIYYSAKSQAFVLDNKYRDKIRRLWVHRADHSGFLYKLPEVWGQQDNLLVCHIPGGTSALELIGDQYLMMAYQLQRVH